MGSFLKGKVFERKEGRRVSFLSLSAGKKEASQGRRGGGRLDGVQPFSCFLQEGGGGGGGGNSGVERGGK